MPANASEREMLRWQFDVVRRPPHILPMLTDKACLWEPAPDSWTVRNTKAGWHVDWSEPVPDPAPPVTVGWLTWHILWWRSSAIAAVRSLPVAPREPVLWPGNARATVRALDTFAAQWSKILGSARSAIRGTSLARSGFCSPGRTAN